METIFGNDVHCCGNPTNSGLQNGGSGIWMLQVTLDELTGPAWADSKPLRTSTMGLGAKLRAMWERIRPPTMKESDTDVGTALFVSPEVLFCVRFAFALVLLFNGTSNRFFGSYHWLSYVNITASVAFLLLAISSLLVAYDYVPMRIFATFVEAFYFTAATLTFASIFSFTAMTCMLVHFAMGPRVRVRAAYIILPLMCHVPQIVRTYVAAGYFQYWWNVMGEFIGITAVSLLVFTLTKMKNFQEANRESINVLPSNPSYVEIS